MICGFKVFMKLHTSIS